jgi:hypothetical protein
MADDGDFHFFVSMGPNEIKTLTSMTRAGRTVYLLLLEEMAISRNCEELYFNPKTLSSSTCHRGISDLIALSVISKVDTYLFKINPVFQLHHG